MFDHISHSIRDVFSNWRSTAAFLLSWALFFFLIYMIPVRAIPGNDILFQATVYNLRDYLQLGVLSFFSVLILFIQAAVFRKQRAIARSTGVIAGAGVLSGIVSSIFTSASCILCVGSLFGFVSGNALVLLVENQTPIFLAGLALLLLSLHFSAKRLHGACESCRIGA